MLEHQCQSKIEPLLYITKFGNSDFNRTNAPSELIMENEEDLNEKLNEGKVVGHFLMEK